MENGMIEENRVRCHADNMQIKQWDAVCLMRKERDSRLCTG
ncbi:MAG: hypothetical protein ACLUEW_06660 [Lachnospiraceae bacterium]